MKTLIQGLKLRLVFSYRGWDGWTASPIQWTWLWANCGRYWRAGKSGVLQSMGLKSCTRLSDWTTPTLPKQPSLWHFVLQSIPLLSAALNSGFCLLNLGTARFLLVFNSLFCFRGSVPRQKPWWPWNAAPVSSFFSERIPVLPVVQCHKKDTSYTLFGFMVT